MAQTACSTAWMASALTCACSSTCIKCVPTAPRSRTTPPSGTFPRPALAQCGQHARMQLRVCVRAPSSSHYVGVCACVFTQACACSHFKGWAPNAAGVVDYKAMEFTNGQTCWNGPARSLKVLLECDVTDALKSIEEPSKCTYEARFGTPAACDPTELEALKLMMEEEHAPAVKEDL
ncbi:hypothetical protein EON67_01555 [archaeon]|nr:MAG: hypothetical protein EON67_01555 [archaeon]